MSIDSKACRILQSADNDLKTVMQALVSAQPDRLETAQNLLEGLVRSLGELDSSVRRDPSTVSQTALQDLRATLGRAGAVSRIALGSVERRMTHAGIDLADSGITLQVQG